ncbi:histone deacetylase 5 [Tanacetum coccineum]
MKFPPNDTSRNGAQQHQQQKRRVGLVYDERMCKHSTPKGEPHPENPDRIRAVWNKLVSAGIPQRCVVFKAKEVEDKYIAAVHTKGHINLIKTISSKKTVSQRNKVAATYDSIYFNEGSSESAYLAAGSVLEVAEKVAKGELNSAFAIVRPPGHHAEKSEPMGFCLFNNVAIAASFLLEQNKLGIKKILIVDWDVHHGNATQKMFWKDSRVLSFSVHRHENGSFYPGGDDGLHTMVGEGPGLGYNINVPWENGHCDEADYIAVWDHILIPVAKDFNADIILIAAGFDAAIGDPLGGCCVTPHGFSILLKKLMEFSKGKIVMALEGGYNLESLANSVLACMEVLLEDPSIDESYEVYPFESTWRVIKDVREKLGTFWPILAKKLPKTLTDRLKPLPEIYSSQSEDEDEVVPDVLLKRRKRQYSPAQNSLSNIGKRQKASDTDDSEDVEDPQTHKVLKMKMSNAELAGKLDVDCVSVMTEASRRLCRMEKKVDVYRDRIRQLKDKVAEDNGIIKKQNIAIQEGEKRLQRVLNSEKELKDKLLARVQNDVQIKELKEEQAKVMTANNHMASEIAARDKTLTIKEKEIEVLKQQLISLEAKGKETEARMTEALEKTVSAEHDRHMLLTEYIPEIVFRLLHSDEFLVPTVKLVNLGVKKGYQKALKRIQEKMLSHVTLEKMPGYDDTVTERFYQAVEYNNAKFPYIQEIAANAHKPLKDIMKITPEERKKTPPTQFHYEEIEDLRQHLNDSQTKETGCEVFKAKEVEDKYVEAVHAKVHTRLIKTISSMTDFERICMGVDDSIYFNEGSSESAYLAAGSVLEVAEKVAKGELNSAFAIVRPPGHHAEKDKPMGFCLYNNVAIATQFLIDQKELGINKILIVDWDVHHGNGTQKMFWKDPRVLYFSVHRHEHGTFYPCKNDGSHFMMGDGPGLGYNINVPWENGKFGDAGYVECGDADYVAAWDHILIPVAKEFKPDIILISAGFDAAIGDPLGGCRITPNGYAILLKKLMEFSSGKIIMALEGGYNLDSLANSVLACVELLLEDKRITESTDVYPFDQLGE